MRVISGRFRGHRLKAPPGRDVRPTLDRVRESIFNLPLVRPSGVRVLDLFAGTGALGIEALSRGALHVTFVERDPRAAKVIEENLAHVRAEGPSFRLLRSPVVRALEVLVPPFDLVLADPPYRLGLAADLLERLGAAPLLLATEAVVVVETEVGGLPFDLKNGLVAIFRRRYGESEVTVWSKEEP
jgi:16S rRNA (guanine(966)-N(2))-methyltransferase RsmD